MSASDGVTALVRCEYGYSMIEEYWELNTVVIGQTLGLSIFLVAIHDYQESSLPTPPPSSSPSSFMFLRILQISMNVKRSWRSVTNELNVTTLSAHTFVFVTKVFMEMDFTVQVSFFSFTLNQNRSVEDLSKINGGLRGKSLPETRQARGNFVRRWKTCITKHGITKREVPLFILKTFQMRQLFFTSWAF